MLDLASSFFFVFQLITEHDNTLNLVNPVQWWIFWTWKIIISHFSHNICASPSHVEHAHQKWCPIDFIHGRRSLELAFLETVFNFCFMFLQKYQTSNWWSIFFASSCICFLILQRLSVVNILILIFSIVNLFKTLTDVNFSTLFEFPAWVHWHISISMTYYLPDLR